jgi:hypothetical protein
MEAASHGIAAVRLRFSPRVPGFGSSSSNIAQPPAGAENPNRGFREYGSAEPFPIRRTICFATLNILRHDSDRSSQNGIDFRFGSIAPFWLWIDHFRSTPITDISRVGSAMGGAEADHVLDDGDGSRNTLNLSCDLLPDGLPDLPDGLSGELSVQPLLKKDSASRATQIKSIPPPSRPTEGRHAIVTAAGRDAVGADGAKDEGA